MPRSHEFRDKAAEEFCNTYAGVIFPKDFFRAVWDACNRHRDEIFGNKDPYYKIKESEYEALITERNRLIADNWKLQQEIVALKTSQPIPSGAKITWK